ncbi:MAG: DMT family transporter [Rhodobacteraceae bacterium]|nr:DMT family transporter [Paracoccaceae bacterium]
MRASENLIGAAFMSFAMAAFVVNDALMKLAGTEMGVLQAIFARGLFATPLMGLIAYANGAFRNLPDTTDLWRITWRTIAEIGATFCFVVALFNMPLANVTAVMQSLPLAITLAAALFLGEKISWRRSTAIVVGAIGVLIIIRPGAAGFNAFSLLGLTAVAFVTFRDLIVRRFSASVSSLLVAFVTAATITLASGIGLFFFGQWVQIPSQTVGYLALSAVFVLLAYYFSIAAMRFGEIALVTPFRYTAVLWAILLGGMVFGEIPDRWTIVGIVVILSTGMYTLRRRQKK